MTATRETLREAVGDAIWPIAEGENYTGRKQDMADAALSAIEAAGWRIVPVEPSPEMLAATAPNTEPAYADYELASKAVDLLPANDHPDIADVLAMISADYRAMLSAAPRLDATVRGEEG